MTARDGILSSDELERIYVDEAYPGTGREDFLRGLRAVEAAIVEKIEGDIESIVAAAIFGFESFDAGDSETIADGVAYWKSAWIGALDKEPWAGGAHSGGCTKQPHTCARCVVERTHELAREAIDAARQRGEGEGCTMEVCR